ncbi:usp family protein [Schizosaccharomyces japonicus yFS275]|uniref:Usp family protein n=1 Tax=Schizosaccharomyces japonicus (strain yFS275 / FY16936) TaxID=402676 RepID=B6K6U2_SCHJY|nr:usp family protein [Schizosaccharomyces japonicus yFS275]EEB09246.1 usp family protein [Schizosaccharomyces japonicus yFS275]
MFFDAAKTGRLRKRAPASLESALDEERKEVLRWMKEREEKKNKETAAKYQPIIRDYAYYKPSSTSSKSKDASIKQDGTKTTQRHADEELSSITRVKSDPSSEVYVRKTLETMVSSEQKQPTLATTESERTSNRTTVNGTAGSAAPATFVPASPAASLTPLSPVMPVSQALSSCSTSPTSPNSSVLYRVDDNSAPPSTISSPASSFSTLASLPGTTLPVSPASPSYRFSPKPSIPPLIISPPVDDKRQREHAALLQATTQPLSKSRSSPLANTTPSFNSRRAPNAQSVRANATSSTKLPQTSSVFTPPTISASPLPSVTGSSKEVHPNTNFVSSRIDNYFGSDQEELEHDLWVAKSMSVDIGVARWIKAANRTLRHIRRGDFETAAKNSKRNSTYLVAIDLSAESLYALEWAVGVLLRDGDTLIAVDVIDRNESPAKSGSSKMEAEQMQAMDEITKQVIRLLNKTVLQVEVNIEVVHHEKPKHLLIEMIDYVDPTLVVLGSRGRNHLKGVLLGSFSNYVVNKSSVPVMVARRRLKKTKQRVDRKPRMANNLANAIVDEIGALKLK